MAKLQILKGKTDVTVYVFIPDSTSTAGAGKTGLVFNSSGLVCYYVRPLGSAAQLTLATQTVTGAHSDGGFVEVDSTNMPGIYRLDLSDAICATGVDSVVVMLKGATGMAPTPLEIQLAAQDIQDATPAVDVTQWLGSAPNALVSGRVDSSTGAMASGVVTAAAIAADAIDADAIAAGAIDASALAADAAAEIADQVWDEARADHTAAGSFGQGVASVQGNVTGSVNSVVTDVPVDEAAIADGVWDEPMSQSRGAGSYGEMYKWLAGTSGTADVGGSTTTLVDAERTEADTDYWKGSFLLMTSGPNIGLLRRVTAFNAGTDTLTFAPALPQAIASGNTYLLVRSSFGEVLVDAIKASAIDAAAIATAAIDADAIASDAITAGKIANAAIDAATFAAGAIDAAAIATGAITAAKFAAGAIDAAAIGTGAIDADSIASSAITSAKFASGAIDAAAIAADAIGASELAADAATEVAAAVWDRAESSIVTASSIGLKLKNTQPQRVTKNTALSNFMFLMIDSADHVTGKTGLTVTSQRSIDGAAFAACANSASEVANGIYKLNLAATDLNGDVITLKFTATGADARFVTIITEPAAS